MNYAKNSLEHIKNLIKENKVQEAVDILNHCSDSSLWFQNAKAVCYMRMNLIKEAADLLRVMVYPGKAIVPSEHTPEMIKLNLAEAMMLSGNIAGAAAIINDCYEQSEQKEKLDNTIKNWKKKLPLWKKIDILFGTLPYNTPIEPPAPFGTV